jgi:hypothetical protein
MKTTIPMSEIRAAYAPGEGRHFFDRSTMRFFNSRMPRTGYKGPGGIYFVTSEQFVPSSGPAHPRKFTVRQLVGPGDIKTVGDFNSMTRAEAASLACGYALNPRNS